ncbi:uncharacterized protein STEHIDRAFT_119463 [Stereum hirsutum FP-91666 SS1]|uniref:uncharacterized protein n=1 Tax=Stereum hirsutum (strain FP-91666) TaxID=721885 RepID=UPI000440CCD5|nr:uncharacterized protein STEHIDRAFT_119463 [Stereum hirsutum FP-91666 SS1]EIM90474.1 hypothetical protein STEHIDRAFT_119463 [Stereum hirsutum FP-91666 SS1]
MTLRAPNPTSTPTPPITRPPRPPRLLPMSMLASSSIPLPAVLRVLARPAARTLRHEASTMTHQDPP